MTGRLKLMLAVLAAVAALVLLDRPDSVDAAAVSVAVQPAPRPPASVTTPPPVLTADAPIPDLFAGPPASTGAPVAALQDAAAPRAAPARPFTLLGFREEGGERAAYLLHEGEVATVRVGDVLGQRYRVLALGGDSVNIKDQRSGTPFRIGFEDHQ